MALNFGSISTTINQATRQLNSSLSSVQSLTGAVNQGAAQIQRLASQVGSININASQIINGFQGVSQAVNNFSSVTSQISNLSGLGSVNVNQLLAPAQGLIGGALGQIGQIGSVVSNFTNTVSGITGAVRSLTSGSTFEQLGALIGNFNLEQFATNIIKVIPRDLSELAFAVGGEFDSLRQRIEAIGDVSNLDDFVNLTFNPSGSGSLIGGSGVAVNEGASRSKIPNPLRDHNGFNYIITLGLLTADEYNFPLSYRNRGTFQKYIIRSGGGFYENRYQVFDEQGDHDGDGAGHAEYYIEDLEIDAVIAPNPNTSVAMGTTVRFTVIEPYSMGNFIEAIVGSAKESNYNNVVGAPFCLKIDFVGWNEDGQNDANFVTQPIFIPINIINMEFNVSGQGSTYQVEAVAYSETGLDDRINTTMTTINAVGSTVYEVLNGEDRSVTSALNQRIAGLEDSEVLTVGDRYIIAFPQDLNGMANAIAGISPGIDSILTGAEQVRRERGLPVTPPGLFGGVEESLEAIVVPPSSQLFEILNSYARDPSRMNEIGLSIINEDTATGGEHAQANPNQAYSEATDTVNRADPGCAPAEKAREHHFDQGDTVTNIIQRVLLSSEYAAEHATEESAANGTRQWFKIETQVYIDETATSTDERGRPARIYVYNVIPYFPDEAKFLGPNERPQNTQGLIESAVKEYNYIYTGLNEDILEFDLNFNNAFLQTALANFGQNPGSAGHLGDRAYVTGNDASQGSGINTNTSESEQSAAGASVEESPNLSNVPASTTRSDNLQLQIAEMFHDRLINQVTDLITAEMRIFGDPFFLPQQTGNYAGQQAAGSPNLTTDGTVSYMQNEVFLVVNFKTPFDYQIQGATMEFPMIVPQFSGLFSCWAITNNFSKGRFEQTLKLIRRRGQEDAPTTGNQGPVVADDARSIVDDFAFYDDAILRQQRANASARTVTPTTTGGSAGTLPARVSVGGVTFDPRTGTFPGQPAGSGTPIYDDAIFRMARNQNPQEPFYEDAIFRAARTRNTVNTVYDDAILRANRLRSNAPSPRPTITTRQSEINREASLRSSAYQQTNYTRAQPFTGLR